METREGNKLIAEFMGGVMFHPRDNKNIIAYRDVPPLIQSFTIENARYHESWDWLIPVVEKCGKLTTEQLRPSINHCNKLDWIECEIGTFLRDCDIKNVWLKVTEFIIFFNEKKEPKPTNP